MRVVVLCVVLMVAASAPSHAEDGTTFRRTTPRSPLHVAADKLVFGIPSGRAWGLESALIRIGSHATVALDLGVQDERIREGFVRIAWYDREEGRPRQMQVADAPIVLPGVERRVVVRLEAPEHAVAFRIRILARVIPGATASGEDALTVSRLRLDPAARSRPALTRLRSEPP